MIDISDQRNQHLLAHPHFLTGLTHEQERIIKLIELRLEHVTAIAQAMGEPEDVLEWTAYPRATYLELERLVKVIRGELPVISDSTVELFS